MKYIICIVYCIIGFLMGYFIIAPIIRPKDESRIEKHINLVDSLRKEETNLNKEFMILIYERGYDQGIECASDSTKSRREKKWLKDSTDMANTINSTFN